MNTGNGNGTAGRIMARLNGWLWSLVMALGIWHFIAYFPFKTLHFVYELY